MDENILKYIITPVSALYIGNWYLSLEFDKLIEEGKIKDHKCKRINSFEDLKTNDILVVSASELCVFVDKILDKLKSNIKIILITVQYHLHTCLTGVWHWPRRDTLTDYVLNHDNIIHWYSHNPIYIPSNKYSPFPFGIQMNRVKEIYGVFKLMNKETLIKRKVNGVYNGSVGVHPHLPYDHIRHSDIFAKKPVGYYEYLSHLITSKYIISPSGDREDCFRHWESLLLGCIPISNISKDKYYPLFGDDMIYDCDVNKMKDYIDGNIIPEYTLPDRKKLMVSYWKNKIKENIKEIVNE